MAKQKKEIRFGSKVEYIEPLEDQVGVIYVAQEEPNRNGFVLIKSFNKTKSTQIIAHVLDLKHCTKSVFEITASKPI
jgi:co-chaperonin GroES (HSP10)